MHSRIHNEDLDDTRPARSARSLRPPSGEGEKSWRNFYIGAGVIGVVAAIGAVVLATKPDPKPVGVGLKVSPRCTGYEITDPMRLRNALRSQIAVSSRRAPVDPFAETTSFLSKRFKCVSYPNPARSPAEAELFAVVFKMVTNIMEQELLASAEQRKTYDRMLDTWSASQGVVPPNAPAEPPGDGEEPADVPIS